MKFIITFKEADKATKACLILPPGAPNGPAVLCLDSKDISFPIEPEKLKLPSSKAPSLRDVGIQTSIKSSSSSKSHAPSVKSSASSSSSSSSRSSKSSASSATSKSSTSKKSSAKSSPKEEPVPAPVEPKDDPPRVPKKLQKKRPRDYGIVTNSRGRAVGLARFR